jgi:hypothetical protein
MTCNHSTAGAGEVVGTRSVAVEAMQRVYSKVYGVLFCTAVPVRLWERWIGNGKQAKEGQSLKVTEWQQRTQLLRICLAEYGPQLAWMLPLKVRLPTA